MGPALSMPVTLASLSNLMLNVLSSYWKTPKLIFSQSVNLFSWTFWDSYPPEIISWLSPSYIFKTEILTSTSCQVPNLSWCWVTIHPIVQYLKPVLPLPFFLIHYCQFIKPYKLYLQDILSKPDHFLPPLPLDAPSKIHRNYCKSFPLFHPTSMV